MNVEKLMADLNKGVSTSKSVSAKSGASLGERHFGTSFSGKDSATINKTMASATSPQEAISKLTSKFPGASSEMLNAFKDLGSKIPGGIDSLKTASTDALGKLQSKFGTPADNFAKLDTKLTESGMKEQLEYYASPEGRQEAFNKAKALLESPELQAKMEEAEQKVENIKSSDSIKQKLSAGFKKIKEADFTPIKDRLSELFKDDGLELKLEEAATKAQMEIDKFEKEGGFQKIQDVNKEQLDGLTTQMAKFNTNFDPSRYSTDVAGELGKYKMNPEMLQEAGMLQKGLGEKFRSGALSASTIVNNPSSWVGGGKPGSKAEFLQNFKAQESGYKTALNSMATKMKSNGAFFSTDSAKEQGSMMAVASKIGPAAAKQWRTGNVSALSSEQRALADTVARNGAYGISVLGVKR